MSAVLRFSNVPATRRRGNPPTFYSQAVAERILVELMMGATLTEVCNDPRNPSKRTICKWLASPDRADFRELYYEARRIGAEMRVDEIVEIADNTSGDYRVAYHKDGTPYVEVDNEHIQRSRVRIDVRKWLAAKLIPRIYGERAVHEHDVIGDLAALLKSASNQDHAAGLPPPIEGEVE